MGGFAVSAETEYPELCMRIADAYFNTETDNCLELWIGAPEDNEYSFGMTAVVYDAEAKAISFDENALKGLNSYEHLLKYVAGRMPFFGAVAIQDASERYAEAYGWDVDLEMKFDLTNGDSHYRSTVYSNLVPYAGGHYPSATFISTEDADRISEITAVAHPVITENIALFVTGKRPLSEIDDFKKEMTELGMDEVLEIYTKAYAALQ